MKLHVLLIEILLLEVGNNHCYLDFQSSSTEYGCSIFPCHIFLSLNVLRPNIRFEANLTLIIRYNSLYFRICITHNEVKICEFPFLTININSGVNYGINTL